MTPCMPIHVAEQVSILGAWAIGILALALPAYTSRPSAPLGPSAPPGLAEIRCATSCKQG